MRVALAAIVWRVRLARDRRLAARVGHTGTTEHPVGSMRDCPGCVAWSAVRSRR